MNECWQCVASRSLKARINGSFRIVCGRCWKAAFFLQFFHRSVPKIEIFCSCFLLKFPLLLFVFVSLVHTLTLRLLFSFTHQTSALIREFKCIESSVLDGKINSRLFITVWLLFLNAYHNFFWQEFFSSLLIKWNISIFFFSYILSKLWFIHWADIPIGADLYQPEMISTHMLQTYKEWGKKSSQFR